MAIGVGSIRYDAHSSIEWELIVPWIYAVTVSPLCNVVSIQPYHGALAELGGEAAGDVRFSVIR